MIPRQGRPVVERLLERAPAVVLTGIRQVGKTTLALDVARRRHAVYLDLERPSDLAQLADVEHYCRRHADRLVVFDEIHRTPGLFQPLRSIIDERRRGGRRNGHFLFLGSASVELLKQSGETLAGRVAHFELRPFDVLEVPSAARDDHWLRGGLPDSFLAADDRASLEWRLDFVKTYLERDIPALGPRIPGETLRRFWTMLAHNQGRTFNAAHLARSLGLKGVTVGRYLDLMVDLLLVRRLPAWSSNVGKRLVKAPKTYLRDSGLCHALLGIESYDSLLAHPVVGGSWEGFVVENILGALPAHARSGYYRTRGGAEVDLVLDLGAGRVWAVEVKRTYAPSVSRGFHVACDDIQPARKYVVHAGRESFPLPHGMEATTLSGIMERLTAEAGTST